MDSNALSQLFFHLNLIPTIGPGIVEKLVKRVGSQRLLECRAWSIADFIQQAGLSERTASLLYTGLRDTELVKREIDALEKVDATCITVADEAYPKQLHAIHLPPLVLYVKGSVQALAKPGLALVGSRLATNYAKQAIEMILTQALPRQIPIISGGARGADTMAHTLCLQGQGTTVAVLGSGLGQLYPPENRRLFEKISNEGGAVISSYPLMTSPLPGNFPARNRIIAGLSSAIIVVQAAEKSGALITAKMALDEGRSVGAVPGPFNEELSAGCNELISQGAHVVASSQHVQALMGWATTEVTQKMHQMTVTAPIKNPLESFCSAPRTLEEVAHFLKVSTQEAEALLFQAQLDGTIDTDILGRYKTN
jgi:DNA processing protein